MRGGDLLTTLNVMNVIDIIPQIKAFLPDEKIVYREMGVRLSARDRIHCHPASDSSKVTCNSYHVSYSGNSSIHC